MGFGELIARHLTDPRRTNTRSPLSDLLRQSVYSRLAGYEDVKDAGRLSQGPTFRLIRSEKIWDCGARRRCGGEGKSYTQAVSPTAGQFPDYPQRTQILSAKLSNYMDETPQALEKKA